MPFNATPLTGVMITTAPCSDHSPPLGVVGTMERTEQNNLKKQCSAVASVIRDLIQISSGISLLYNQRAQKREGLPITPPCLLLAAFHFQKELNLVKEKKECLCVCVCVCPCSDRLPHP